MPKSKSAKQWLARQAADPFVKEAKAQGLRARSAFKLAEIAEKYHLLLPNMTVIDLGAAPGGWSQYIARALHNQVHIVAVDLLPMGSLPCVEFIQGDFRDEAVYEAILQALNHREVSLVISDMAPNMTGTRGVDQPRAMYLAELALDFAKNTMAPKGNCLIKCFQGEGFEAFVQACRETFKQVIISKPAASRASSREMYILGRKLAQKRSE
ncbi:MAG: rlmE [Gammaproteobacteria bacterium]|jgi:23S rRNA (uridine2552-2'-O)-methyltransferase|nr:rlmE [Gammaproteobacteria bacterium]